MKKSLHWMDRKRDPNVQTILPRSMHINRPRISSQTIVKLLALKAQLSGTRLDILKEAQAFEERNAL